MKTELNINELIDKAQELVHDGQISGAAMGKMLVQEIEIDGDIYKLSVMLEIKK